MQRRFRRGAGDLTEAERPAQARQILKKLLMGPLVFTPKDGHYEFSGDVSFGKLLGEANFPIWVASLSIPSWNQIAGFLESMRQLRDSAGFAA